MQAAPNGHCTGAWKAGLCALAVEPGRNTTPRGLAAPLGDRVLIDAPSGLPMAAASG